MTDLTIRPAYRTWPKYNHRVRDVLAAMTDEQLALRPSPDRWPIWATAGHTACQRVFWLCDFAGEPGAETTPFTNAAFDCPGDDDLDHPLDAKALVVLPVEVVDGGLGGLTPALLVAALAVAIFSTALPLSLEFEALKRMTARSYGILVTLEPVVATLVGALVLDQAIGLQGILAVVCVTIAALGVTISDRRESGTMTS